MYGSGQVWRRPFPFFGSRGGPSHSLSLPLFQTGLFTYTHTRAIKSRRRGGEGPPHYGNTRNRTSVGRSVDRMTRPNRRYGTEEPPRLGFLPCKKGGCGGGGGRGGCSRVFLGGVGVGGCWSQREEGWGKEEEGDSITASQMNNERRSSLLLPSCERERLLDRPPCSAVVKASPYLGVPRQGPGKKGGSDGFRL